MAQQFTQEQLEEMVVGKSEKPRAVFYDQAELDQVESVKAGRRIYRTATYVKLTQPGVTDWVPKRARKEDFLEYPEEYGHYKENRQGNRSPSISIVPGMDIVHKQELIDFGIGTIDQLASAEVLPQHLVYAQDMAKRIQVVLKQEKVSAKDKQKESEGPRSDGEAIQSEKIEEVLAASRLNDSGTVGQPNFPGGHGPTETGTSERVQESRRDNHRENGSLIPSPNFQIQFG